jgi:hypothetical protein
MPAGCPVAIPLTCMLDYPFKTDHGIIVQQPNTRYQSAVVEITNLLQYALLSKRFIQPELLHIYEFTPIQSIAVFIANNCATSCGVVALGSTFEL